MPQMLTLMMKVKLQSYTLVSPKNHIFNTGMWWFGCCNRDIQMASISKEMSVHGTASLIYPTQFDIICKCRSHGSHSKGNINFPGHNCHFPGQRFNKI